MFLRPKRSASDPQNGDEMNSIAPVAVASTPDQSAAAESVFTPRSLTKNGMKGKTRFAPMSARNCDAQTAYRFFSQVSSFTRRSQTGADGQNKADGMREYIGEWLVVISDWRVEDWRPGDVRIDEAIVAATRTKRLTTVDARDSALRSE